MPRRWVVTAGARLSGWTCATRTAVSLTSTTLRRPPPPRRPDAGPDDRWRRPRASSAQRVPSAAWLLVAWTVPTSDRSCAPAAPSSASRAGRRGSGRRPGGRSGPAARQGRRGAHGCGGAGRGQQGRWLPRRRARRATARGRAGTSSAPAWRARSGRSPAQHGGDPPGCSERGRSEGRRPEGRRGAAPGALKALPRGVDAPACPSSSSSPAEVCRDLFLPGLLLRVPGSDRSG